MYLNKDSANLVQEVEVGVLFGTAVAMSIMLMYESAKAQAPTHGVKPITESLLDYAVKQCGKGVLIGAFLGGAAGYKSVEIMDQQNEVIYTNSSIVGDLLPEEV